jgi:hypothetical protein
LRKDPVLAQKVSKKYPLLLAAVIIIVVAYSSIGIKNTNLIDWDEGVFALQGKWLASIGDQGKPYNFQTPPLFQIIISILFRLFGYHAYFLQFISLAASCFTVYFIYKISSLFGSPDEGLIAALLFTSTEFFLFFCRSGLSDATFLLFISAAIFFFLKGLKTTAHQEFLWAGIFLTLSAYTKYSAFPFFISFAIIGFLNRRSLKKQWFTLSLILPTVLYIPYVLLFIKIVSISQISARHINFLDLNHIKHLFYLFAFAPLTLLAAVSCLILGYRSIRRINSYLLIFFIVFFLFLGFYFPYFRLAYPLVALLAIIGAQLIQYLGKHRYLTVKVMVILALLIGLRTISYKSHIAESFANIVQFHAQEDVKYLFSDVPPNVAFYLDYEPLVEAGHQWERIGKHMPFFMGKKKIIYRENNELKRHGKTLLIHASVFDDLKKEYPQLFQNAILLETNVFIDAPMYYRDIFYPERYAAQRYEIYLIDNSTQKALLDEVWAYGFDQRVTVMLNE